MLWRLEFALAWLLTCAGLVRAQEIYTALLNIPGNAPASLVVIVRGFQSTGWTTEATVKVPTGVVTAPTRDVVFQLTKDCVGGHVYYGSASTPSSAACWPIPVPIAPAPNWWGMSITLSDAERKAVAAAAKVGIAVAVQPTESFVSTVLVAWPVP